MKKYELGEKEYTSYGYRRLFNISEEESREMQKKAETEALLQLYSRFYFQVRVKEEKTSEQFFKENKRDFDRLGSFRNN